MDEQNRLAAVLGAALVAALGGFLLLKGSPVGPSAGGYLAQVTGYATSNFFTETGPVSVQLRGASAARIEQIVEGLPEANAEYFCAENWKIYKVTFTSGAGAHQHFELDGYACGSLVVETPPSRGLGDLIDQNCALLAAVRRVLPASAIATDAGACSPASPQLIAGTSS